MKIKINRSMILTILVVLGLVGLVAGVNYLQKVRSDISSSFAGACTIEFNVPTPSGSPQ